MQGRGEKWVSISGFVVNNFVYWKKCKMLDLQLTSIHKCTIIVKLYSISIWQTIQVICVNFSQPLLYFFAVVWRIAAHLFDISLRNPWKYCMFFSFYIYIRKIWKRIRNSKSLFRYFLRLRDHKEEIRNFIYNNIIPDTLFVHKSYHNKSSSTTLTLVRFFS